MDLNLNLTYSQAQELIFFKSSGKFNIFPKGRRLGFTRGGANFFVDYMASNNGTMLLWGDTVNSNIRKYFERYFTPALKQVPQSLWDYNISEKVLKIRDSVCDFRSADQPENWEGFGYDIILLNEAGIILSDPYLYDNAVLPMLMDNPNAKLIAAGVPKGKYLKGGEEHKFYTLWKRVLEGKPGYYGRTFTSYDTPFISKKIIDTFRDEMPDMVFRQEIMAQFVDITAGMVFKKAQIVDEVPEGAQYFIGCDLAYSKATRADHSVLATIAKSGNNIYIVNIERWRSEMAETITRIRAFLADYPNNKLGIEANGPQKGIYQVIQKELPGTNIKAILPVADKLTRSLPFAMKWNRGEVFVLNRHWTRDLIYEFDTFTGDGKTHDDQIDAVVNAFAESQSSGVGIRKFQRM